MVYEFYLRGFTFTRMDLYPLRRPALPHGRGEGDPDAPLRIGGGLGETAALSLAEQRKGKQFISIEEVSAALPQVSKTHIEMLKNAGAFGDLPETSQMDLFFHVG